jgi:transposase
MTDTLGLILFVVVCAASIADSDGAEYIFHETEGRFPRLGTVLVDQGYKSWLVEFAKRWFGVIVDIVQRPTGQREFIVQPQRWKIERTFGWLDWSRVLSKEYERTTESSESDIYLASIRLMLRRLASSSKWKVYLYSLYSGIMFSQETLDDIKGRLPLGIARTGVWLHEYALADDMLLSPFNGPLAGLEFTRDRLGVRPVLALHPIPVARCGLKPDINSPQLTLVDSQGKLAVLFRYWSVRALGRHIGEESSRLRGCDVIVRPDIFERFARMSKLASTEMTVIKRKARSGTERQ